MENASVSHENHFMNREARRGKKSKAYWRAPHQEKDLSRRLGAKQISRSGAGTKKGDLFIEGVVRIEAKTTSANSFSVSKTMLDKIRNSAMACGEIPVLVVEFLDIAGKPEAELAICDLKQLELLISHAASANNSKT